MEIYDISNPNQMDMVGWFNPWNCETPNNLWFNSPGHVNQLSYSDADQLLFMSAGGSELTAVDVSDPFNPIGLKSFGMPMNGRGSWGLDLKGNSIILTYINALIPFVSSESGLRRINWHITTEVAESEEDVIEIQVYPNPAAKELFIAVNKPLEIESVYLHHILGFSQQLNISSDQTTDLLRLDVGGFGPGLYYLQVKLTGRDFVTIPVVIR